MRKRLGKSVVILVAVMFCLVGFTNLARAAEKPIVIGAPLPRRSSMDGMRNGASSWRSRKLMPPVVSTWVGRNGLSAPR
jgi:hypothetical protein